MSIDHAAGGFHRQEVDRLIHEPARYNIMALLFVVARAEFLFVQNQIGMTPGNLSAHVSKLEAADYIRVEKKFVGKKPKTFLKLTKKGRAAFEDYRKRMTEVVTTSPEVNSDSES